MQYNLSKSRYCQGLQCPKMLWLKKNKPEVFDDSCMNEAILKTGLAVGDLAMGLFGDFVEVPFGDLNEMIAATKDLMDRGTPVIAEASFAVDGLFCSMDILVRLSDGRVALYEVKSSTSVKPIHHHDAAFQYYVISQSGYDIASCNIVHINNRYVRNGDLDIHQLFTIADITPQVLALQADIADHIANLRNYVAQVNEPAKDIGLHCFSPYDCGFFGYCARHLPSPSVFDVAGIGPEKQVECYQKGIVTFADLAAGEVLTETQQVQVDFELNDRPAFVDKAQISEFLKKLTFPLYFLDFESFQSAIPLYDGTRPNQQLVFQYSLHIQQSDDGELQHKVFLAKTGADPRRALAEQLCADIPRDACVAVYNMGFEKGRIQELADLYPDLKDHLQDIRSHIVDMMIPFRKKWYYSRELQGSYSIKKVLPALFPGDPSLNYSSLAGIHKGDEAAEAFLQMQTMTEAEQAPLRQQLLDYCGLDTYALVKIREKLLELCK